MRAFCILPVVMFFGCAVFQAAEPEGPASTSSKEGVEPPTPWALKVTYYYVSDESHWQSGSNATLYTSDCLPLAEVSGTFFDRACMEGTAILRDGRLLNYASKCDCGRPCPTGGTVC